MSKKKDKRNAKRITGKQMESLLMDLFHSSRGESLGVKTIFSTLHLTTHPQKALCVDILYQMVDSGYLIVCDEGHFTLNNRGTEITGTFLRKTNGKNAFIPNGGGEPILIAERNSFHAMNNDKVKIMLLAKRKNRQTEGEVIEIIQRANDTFVGTLNITRSYAFLITENRTLANDIFIPKDRLKGGNNGDKAIVKIIEWPGKAKNPIGTVVEILGKAGENNTEMHAILAEYGLPYSYPKAAEKAAEKIPRTIPIGEYPKREDFRTVTTFTIDPDDAKDFDDALSIRPIKDNLWEIGIHIADVSWYVKENSVIDKEAQKRGTSIYLVDRTIPMLPERLCNDICSLRPDEEKLAFSVIFYLDIKGEIKKTRILRTVIKSRYRFTYEQAQKVIETGTGELSNELLTLNTIAKALRVKRLAQGAIDFNRSEVKFNLDDNGKPLGVYFKETKEANMLIEEFMLLANKAVAEFVGNPSGKKSAKVFPYRVHDVPDPEKLENLSQFISRFGFKLRTSGSKTELAGSVNRLLHSIKGTKEEAIIQTVSIRAMQKAYYSTVNIGHYGLAFRYYTHFTSPIRRYPDLMVHRLLARYLDNGRSAQKEKYENLCRHSSQMEQLAANAERASVKYKQVEFMSAHLGEVFKGVISGVTEWGLYVELNENKCEGMVPIRELDDDYYELDEKNFRLIGKRKHRMYNLGDEITVTIARASLDKRQLDFALYSSKT